MILLPTEIFVVKKNDILKIGDFYLPVKPGDAVGPIDYTINGVDYHFYVPPAMDLFHGFKA